MRRAHHLTKSSFLQAVRCQKLLYLDRFHPELAKPLDAPTLRRLKEGRRVHQLARELFPHGVDARADDPGDLEACLAKTQGILAEGGRVLFEAAIRQEGVFAFVDVLVQERTGWTIHEVKSSTGLHDRYTWDVALQMYLLERSGLELGDAYLVHLNGEYRRQGRIDPLGLFVSVPILELCRELMGEVEANIEEAEAVLSAGTIPEVDIGPYCDKPYECRYKGYCWRHIPEKSVFDVYYLPTEKKFDLYQRGVLRMEDIPDDYPLQARPAFHVAHHKRGDKVINRSVLSDFLDDLQYPLHFLDFETYATAIPPFEGVAPYEPIPFQWSVHVLEEPGAEPVHHGFLAEPGRDPRRRLAEALMDTIQQRGDIVAFFSSFEKRVLDLLVRELPDRAAQLRTLQERLVDLRTPFAQRDFYLPKMEGSSSMKSILPAVVSEMGYEDLEITQGEEASEAFLKWSETENPEEARRLRNALWEYCAMDTRGMVAILEVIEQVVADPSFVP